MRKRLLFSDILLIILLSPLFILGCGGSTSTSPNIEGVNNSGEYATEFSAYVFVPSTSSQSLFKSYNLIGDNMDEEGVLLLDSPDQAPLGYEPLINCKITLPDGTYTITDQQGRFYFSNIPYTRSEKGIPLEVNAEGSNRPQFAKSILPVIIPRRGEALDSEDLHLIIEPSSLLLKRGSKFFFRVFVVDNCGVAYQIPGGIITWSVIAEVENTNIGSIAPSGLFHALNFGKGQVSANVQINSTSLEASSEIEIVNEEQITRIYGQVTDIMQRPIPGVMIFINSFENGVITDQQGNYLIPHVPEEKNLSLTFTYRGTVVKILQNVFLNSEETKEINVVLDAFHETGEISYRIDSDQNEGRVIFTVDGLTGPLSSNEFLEAKKFELLGVPSIDPNLYSRLIEDQDRSFSALAIGTILSPSEGDNNPLPQVEVDFLKIIPRQGTTIRTLQGEIFWHSGQVYFQGEQGNSGNSRQFIVEGLNNFPDIDEKLQNSPDTRFAGKVIGFVNLSNQKISLLEISLFELFFQSEGEIYYDPEASENGAIMMEVPSSNIQDLFILHNIEDISLYIYNILIASPLRKFPGMVYGIKTNEYDSTEYIYPIIKTSRILISSNTDDYLVHRRGEIRVGEDGLFFFSPSYSLEEELYILSNIEEFDGVYTSVEESPEKAFYCFLSGEIQESGEEENINGSIIISQFELLEPVTELDQTVPAQKPDGFVYFEIDRELPVGGRFLYQELENGTIGTKLYELVNLDTRDPELANLLESWPGLTAQIILNASVTEDLSGKQATTPGPTRLLINYMEVLQEADPILKVQGNIVYHSWENIVELIATSPSLAPGIHRSFIMRKIPAGTLSMLLNHPDQFIPVSGMIQVFQKEKRSINDPLIAEAFDLRALINPD